MHSFKRKILNWALGLSCAVVASESWAQAVVSVSASPNRSRNGEAVMYKIQVKTSTSGRVAPPNLDGLQNWEVINSFRSERPSVVYSNGKAEYRYAADYSYFLRPLQVGSLQIPSIDLRIGEKIYKTDAITVQVESLPNAQNSRPKTQKQSRRNQLPPHFQGGQTLPQSQAPAEDDFYSAGSDPATGGGFGGEIPERDSFFVRPEFNVKEAYVGQMIELKYVLYQRSRTLRNFEMAKFPDFKGFLKEELFITKNFSQERVQVGNEVMLRSEIIRYALFPLKAGELKIDSFKVRAESFSSPEDLLNSLLTGAPTPQMGTAIPMEKSSGVVTIKVKELPPTPPGVIFTGAVGNFDIEMKGPPERITLDQPFTVQFTIAGKGNVKMIEEAPLPLPAGIELFETKNTSELRPDTSGYKSFEYLLLPRKNGEVVLEPFKWAYFDPTTQKYEIKETQRLVFQIEGTPSPSDTNNSGVAQKPIEKRVSPFDVAKAPLEQKSKRVARERIIWTAVWSALGALYLALGFIFAKRRREDLHRTRLKDNPWEKTAIAIEEKNYKNPTELTILVDQWTREYLTGHLKTPDLHAESSRSEFERALYRRLPVEFQQFAAELAEFWRDLDLARFAGSQKWPLETKPTQLFPQGKELCKKIVSRCRFEDQSADSDEDE